MIRNFIFCFALLLGVFSYAQLPAFTLDIEVTPETCYDNGVIDVEVDGVASGATVSYVIYKMPDETTPVANGAGGAAPNYPYSFEGLDSGDYKVVATQSLGGETGTEIAIVSILDETDPVTTETTVIDDYILCGNDGEITITLQQGTAASYELFQQQPDGTFQSIAGPQVSNVFTNLTGGVYAIEILDAQCGDVVSMEHTLDYQPLGPVQFLVGSQLEVNSVASESLVQRIIEAPAYAFPITVTFTVYPPDGSAPVVVSQQIQYSGDSDPMQVAVNQIIPYYNGMYFYDINVTNSCGALFSFNLLNMPAFFDLNAEPVAETCYENGEIIA